MVDLRLAQGTSKITTHLCVASPQHLLCASAKWTNSARECSLLKKVIEKSTAKKQIKKPLFFTMPNKNSYLISDRLDTRSGNNRCEVVCDNAWYHRNTRLTPGAKRNWPTEEDEQYISNARAAIQKWLANVDLSDSPVITRLRYDAGDFWVIERASGL